MRACTIYLVVLSMAATLVLSRPSASYLTQSFRALSTASYKRQSSGYVPSQCTSICDPVSNEVNAVSQSLPCLSTTTVMCVGTALNATDYTHAQVDLDQLYVSCFDYGYTLKELTLPGQNPSRTLSTSLLVGSAFTSTSASSVLPSSTSPASSGTSTPTSAALGLGMGGGGVWALAAAAIGLVVL
ncbi:hypothetical protein EV702DRAFT_1146237 [Suillus placidus]|uniref:Uncharacterized protein n=1 Tax=Suillus placidus TaxID=48579 RepID=A0A9P6ZJ09_9AGAM|nr:hypothetical protein EV702DRAFT_1146237 [Suillus placidus]